MAKPSGVYNIVIKYKNPDGSLRVTYLDEADRLEGELDVDFAERIRQSHALSTPDLLTLPFEIRPYTDLPNANKKRKWREQTDGSLIVDNSVETEQEKKEKNKLKAKTELKALGLSDDAIKALGL